MEGEDRGEEAVPVRGRVRALEGFGFGGEGGGVDTEAGDGDAGRYGGEGGAFRGGIVG